MNLASNSGVAQVVLRPTYVNDTPLSNTTTWNNTTLAALGLSIGDNTWTWGSGSADNQSFSIDVVPLPAAFPLFASGLGAMGLLGWRKKRRAPAVA